MTSKNVRKNRLKWFFKKHLIIYGAILIFLIFVFITAKNSTSIFLVVSEGMEARASVVMNDTDVGELSYYFTQNGIDNDGLVQSGKYENYIIGKYTYVLSPQLPICLPLQGIIRVRVSEIITGIDGELSQDKIAEADATTRVPPDWESGEYDVYLVNQDGVWKIDRIQPVYLYTKAEEND